MRSFVQQRPQILPCLINHLRHESAIKVLREARGRFRHHVYEDQLG